MKSTMAGPAGVFLTGQIASFDDGHAQALIAAGYAEPVQTASVAPPERAVRPDPAPRTPGPVPVSAVVGAELAEALQALGVATAPQLLAADDELLTSIKGVGPATVRRWRDAARELLS